jgi:hypothetical protein
VLVFGIIVIAASGYLTGVKVGENRKAAFDFLFTVLLILAVLFWR